MTDGRVNFMPLRRLAFPAVLIIGTLIGRYTLDVPADAQPILDWLAWIALGLALALSSYHGHARLFTLSLSLLVAYYVVGTHLQIALSNPDALRLYTLVSILLPLQILFLMCISEKGLWNRHGILAISSIPVLLITGILVLSLIPAEALLQFIEKHLSVKPISGYILSIYASIGFLVLLLAGVFKLLRHDNEHDAALLIMTLLMFLLMAFFDQPGISDTAFSLAGITLVVAMVRESYQFAYLDDLTGLPGRRALNERMKTLGKRYVISMIDIDHFKKFNDTYGHDTGDDVLKVVAKHIAAVGGGGTAYRYGGEEFCIVFPAADDPESCTPHLEVVRKTVEKYRIIVRDQQSRNVPTEVAEERRGRRASTRDEKSVSVTISIGVAGAIDETESPDDVLKAADTALYKAKKKGRNRLVVGLPPPIQ